ncbi:MAG: NADH-quinone oxidoreductase subunit L [Anaerolineae bacterium]|nr:MAG: NADH-quinone oxidoreductase subunit L [Anaerolineae bacterium]
MLLSEATNPGGAFNLVPWIVFFPVIGLLVNLVAGKRMGEKFIGTVASLASGLAFAVSVALFFALQANHGHKEIFHLLDWINIGALNIGWDFRIDTLSVTMMLVVSGIGTLIHIYAAGYMHYDVRYKEDPASYVRFFIYLNLFIAMMMILVSGDNYLMLFVGWEGVGLCSFLLIGFWFNRSPDGTFGTGNSYAAKKAFIANRVGDFGFLMAIFTTFWVTHSLQFDEVFHHLDSGEVPAWAIWAIAMFMLLGVTGKSAQIPLYVWLPDAMAGPTPVSALIHAATMVTAGVYLITRSAPIFSAGEGVHNVVAWVGAGTALFAATIAVGQYDIKKVLAYSTVSQLGFMVAAVGMGAYAAGMFHLVTHAFFKALLFLGSGSVILAVERGHHPIGEDAHGDHHDEHHGHDDHGHAFDPQDMRNMGGLRKRIPWTFWTYIMGTLALAGVPIWAGFFSKDEILADALHFNIGIYIVLSIAAFFTAFYMGRQVWLVFFGEPRSHGAEAAKESPRTVLIPLVILAILSTLGGFMNFPEVHQFGHWLEYTLGHFYHPTEFNANVALGSTAFGLAALFISWLVYGQNPRQTAKEKDPLEKAFPGIFAGMNAKWWIDEIYEDLIIRPYQKLAAWLADVLDWRFWHDWFHERVIRDGFFGLTRFLAHPVDLGVIDGIANGLARVTQGGATALSIFQTGFVRNYALWVFVGVVSILGYLIFR